MDPTTVCSLIADKNIAYLVHIWALVPHLSLANVQILVFHIMCTWSFLSSGVCFIPVFYRCLLVPQFLDIQWQFVNKCMNWNITLIQVKCLESQLDYHSCQPSHLLDPEQEVHWFNSICFYIATVWTLISLLTGLFAFMLTTRKVLRGCRKEGVLLQNYFGKNRQSFFVKLLKCSCPNVYFILGHKRVLANAQWPAQ